MLHQNNKRSLKVVNCIFIALLSLALLAGILGFFSADYSRIYIDILFFVISAALFLSYLLIAQFKKSARSILSCLFGSSIVFAGQGILFGIIETLPSWMGVLLTSNLDDKTVLLSILQKLFYFSQGVIYIVLGVALFVMICIKKIQVLPVRVLGIVSFALEVLHIILFNAVVGWWSIRIDEETIVSLAIFVYVCFMPMNKEYLKKTKELEEHIGA